VLRRLQAAFFATRDCDAQSVALIRAETSRRWAAVGRAGLRSGNLTLADVLAARPDRLGLSQAGIDDLLWSAMIGGARRVCRPRERLSIA
ncbi:MAG TPA: glycosyltransferase family 2 protein, partial [Sphingomonas sp.]|nr:glycosyltransferase family 2 protein [Sphingomonas sp.]